MYLAKWISKFQYKFVTLQSYKQSNLAFQVFETYNHIKLLIHYL